ncbi:hypothetical protein ILUMI_26281 [Ignelater luminosus]|uniref:SCAN domain-containing protein n=1 Tax=Ignelater luminosus TaxID=2038154 RepID=A0A8K0FYT8_IGNLU|nr:hypothetical protein ILUMI_26281 [Ignelater luminosus]
MKNKVKPKKVKDEKIYMTHDLTASEREKQKQIREAQEEEKIGKDVKIGYNKVTIDGIIHAYTIYVTAKDLENVEQEMEDAMNAGTASRNEAPTVAVGPSQSLDWLPDNNNAKTFCVKRVNKAEEGYGGKVTCRLCHSKQEIGKKSSAAHVSLQVQSAKMLENSDAKFPPAKIGDNVRIRIPDVDRSRDASHFGRFWTLAVTHTLFRKLWLQKQTPQEWKETVLHPLFKSGDKQNVKTIEGLLSLMLLIRFQKFIEKRLLVTYGCEVCAMRILEHKKLGVCGEKVLRKIYEGEK